MKQHLQKNDIIKWSNLAEDLYPDKYKQQLYYLSEITSMLAKDLRNDNIRDLLINLDLIDELLEPCPYLLHCDFALQGYITENVPAVGQFLYTHKGFCFLRFVLEYIIFELKL